MTISTMILAGAAVWGLIVDPIRQRKVNEHKEKMKIFRILANQNFAIGMRVSRECAAALHDSTTIFNDGEISNLKSILVSDIISENWTNANNSHKRLVMCMAKKLKIKDIESIFEVYRPVHLDDREIKIDKILSYIINFYNIK